MWISTKPFIVAVLLSAAYVNSTTITYAQNIPNPDLENISSCPTQQANLSYGLRATDWTRPTRGTSDYFNSCGFNISSHISAQSGEGFVGSYMELSNGSLNNYKEYLTVQLSSALLAGVTYTFSFYTAHLYGSSPSGISPALNYVDLPAAEQGFIGAVFSTAAPTIANVQPLAGGGSGSTSIVNTFGSGRALIPATNTAVYGMASRNTWVPVSLQYTAVGGEQYMTIGQFREGATSLPDSTAAYYLFDNFTNGLTPLPVTLQDFSGVQDGVQVLLNWSTVTEHNNRGFELERSADGKNWSIIGFLSSKAEGGNSNRELNYQFADAHPLTGTNFYRLKQADFDGRYAYGPVRTLTLGAAPVTIASNPAYDKVVISNLNGSEAVIVHDMTGRELYAARAAGNTLSIGLGDLSAGVYSIRIIQQDGSISTHKLVKN